MAGFSEGFLWGGATADFQYEGGFDEGGKGLSTHDFETDGSLTKPRMISLRLADGSRGEVPTRESFPDGAEAEIYDDVIKNGLILAFAAAFVIHIVYIALTWLLGKALHLNGLEKASVIYTNAGNLIVPIVLSLFGKEWLVYTSGYMVMQAVFMWSHGRMIVCEEKSVSLRKILLNVNMIASVIGILMFSFRIRFPSLVAETMEMMTSMIGPVCMLVAGMIIAGMDLKRVFLFKRIYLMAFIKMIAYPLLILFLMKVSRAELLVPNGNTILMISLLAAIAPMAASIMQMTQVYDKDSEYASAIYFVTTLACIATMPAVVWLYQM